MSAEHFAGVQTAAQAILPQARLVERGWDILYAAKTCQLRAEVCVTETVSPVKGLLS